MNPANEQKVSYLFNAINYLNFYLLHNSHGKPEKHIQLYPKDPFSGENQLRTIQLDLSPEAYSLFLEHCNTISWSLYSIGHSSAEFEIEADKQVPTISPIVSIGPNFFWKVLYEHTVPHILNKRKPGFDIFSDHTASFGEFLNTMGQ